MSAFDSIKKYPTFFFSAAIGALASISASGLALLLPPGVISASGAVEWSRWTAFGSGAAALSVVGVNYAVSLYLFYRDRASAYALNFVSAGLGILVLIKVASLFYF